MRLFPRVYFSTVSKTVSVRERERERERARASIDDDVISALASDGNPHRWNHQRAHLARSRAIRERLA